jgi:hypothetical protein
MKKLCVAFIVISGFLTCTSAAQTIEIKDRANLIKQLLYSRPDLFREVLKNVEKHEVQILYTQINRDKHNNPSFKSYKYRLNAKQYFYPASTVKLASAILALEKLNDLSIPGLNRHTSLRIDSACCRQTSVTHDSSARDVLPSIAHYIKKIFLVSDNDAHNRLYEFIGQKELNQRLWTKGYKAVKLTSRLSWAASPEENRYTNPFTFYDGEKVVYRQPLVFNPEIYRNKLKTTLKGRGYMRGDSLVQAPKDFSESNYLSVESLQNILKAIIFPEAIKKKQRFNLTEEDHRFLYAYMSRLPRESDYPKYDTTAYYDSYGKYFMFGDTKTRIPAQIRIFNKVGQAYGYLIDDAYIVDFENRIEFLLTAVIYVNEDGILNDDNYEYEEVGIPFLANLGRVIYEYEKKRVRQHPPDLTKFSAK